MRGRDRAAASCKDQPLKLELVAFVVGFVPLLLNGLYLAQASQILVVYYLQDLLVHLFIPLGLVIYLLRARVDRITPSWPSFSSGDVGRLLLHLAIVVAGVACSMLLYAQVAIIVRSLGLVGAGSYDSLMLGQLPRVVPLRLLTLAYTSFSAGFSEEFLFRFLLFGVVRRTGLSSAHFVGLSSILFALIHWEQGPAGLASALLLGLSFSLAYVLYRNIFALMIWHSVVDLLALPPG